VVVSGWPGTGKSTIAERIAADLGATVAGYDWVMSGLREVPEVWDRVELPVERQRRVAWNLLLRIAEQQLARGGSCVLDLVARAPVPEEGRALAARYGGRVAVIECTCADPDLHRSRVEGRRRGIPGWYELTWEHVARTRLHYVPLAEPKLVIDAADPVHANHARVRDYLELA